MRFERQKVIEAKGGLAITYGVPMKESLCGNCMRCTRACQGQAISGAN